MKTENFYQETDLGNISPNPRGDYDASAEYEYLDQVFMGGGSYLCRAEFGAKITGIAPEPGKTTNLWQCVAIPGDLTPEYIAMHDDVVNKAESVSEDAKSVEEMHENVIGMETNVREIQKQTEQFAEDAESSKDGAAGYAREAEASRQAASESEANINAQVAGFDTHVEEKTEESIGEVDKARRAAIGAVTAQQTASIQEVKDQTSEFISQKQADAENAIEDKADEYKVNLNFAIKSIQNAGNNQVKNVEDVGSKQVAELQKYKGVKISDAEPTEEEVGVWIDPNDDEEYQIPEIKDDEESEVDTWSSKKIKEGFSALKGDLVNEVGSIINGEKITTVYSLPSFVSGLYNEDNGAITENSAFVRTDGFIQVDEDTDITIVVPDGVYLRIQSWQYYQNTWQYYGREVDAVNYELSGTVNFTLRKYIRNNGSNILAKFAFILHYANNRTITDIDEIVSSVDFGNVIRTDYQLKYIPDLLNNILSNGFKGKKIVFYGDSITAEGNDLNATSWQKYLYDYFGFGSYVGSGIGGTGFCPLLSHKYVLPADYIDGSSLSPSSVISGTSETLVQNMDFSSWYRIDRCIPSDADVILVMGGTNDFGRIVGSSLPTRKRDENNKVYGNWLFDSEITDTTRDIEWTSSSHYATYGGDFNRETVAGAIESTIMKLQAKCPNALIVFATPVKTNLGTQWSNNTNSGQKYLNGNYYSESGEIQLCFETDYQKVIKDVCCEWGIPVIDIYGTCGINHANYVIGGYQGSGVHPNAEGRKMMARAFISGFKNIVDRIDCLNWALVRVFERRSHEIITP